MVWTALLDPTLNNALLLRFPKALPAPQILSGQHSNPVSPPMTGTEQAFHAYFLDELSI